MATKYIPIKDTVTQLPDYIFNSDQIDSIGIYDSNYSISDSSLEINGDIYLQS